MSLPQLLREAEGHLANAEKALRAASTCEPHLFRQLVSEWQHAVDMCSQSIEDWWLMVNIDELSDREKQMREAARLYSEAMVRARDEEVW